MGQFMSSSCIGFNSIIITQERLESMQEEEIIEFESPKHRKERLTTQLSLNNISSSKEIDQGLVTLMTYPDRLQQSKSLDSSSPTLTILASPTRIIYDDSLSSLNYSQQSNIRKYKTRSKNFSTASENLVETLRSPPSPRKSSTNLN
ncbi:hypothetical protein SteCoe_32453 [Stentor coeruleus]|uniref:Uncharacterized protein n=1 Tax=Stentor coeruleus TaxID=5963 RepID=A0A1R2AYZ7_9CILI|nr:hypothetical protein SteCoe_32453 [Stentor coeruleus]